MKKLLLCVIALVFAAIAPMTDAQETKRSGKIEPSVFCCIKGKCQDMTKADCENAGGEEVNDCKDCKRGR